MSLSLVIPWGRPRPGVPGRGAHHTRDNSDETAHVIDEEVTRILDSQADRAATTLARHRPQPDALAHALLEHETLEAADIARILTGEDAEPPRDLRPWSRRPPGKDSRGASSTL